LGATASLGRAGGQAVRSTEARISWQVMVDKGWRQGAGDQGALWNAGRGHGL